MTVSLQDAVEYGVLTAQKIMRRKFMGEEHREALKINVAVAAAKKMAGCVKDCNVELTYCGVVDGEFHNFYLTHKHDGILTQVPLGCTTDETFKAIGRALMGMADHGRISDDPADPA